MQQPFNQPVQQTNTSFSGQMNHGAHEILDTHEVLTGMMNTFNSFLLCEQYIKDPELLDILHRQKQFLTDEYNILVECFQTGRDPSHPTSTYKMNQSNEVQYGLTPKEPSKPNQDVNQIGPKCIANVILSNMKSLATCMTMAAAECTNPVVRRVLADSIPNHIEMAYEIFLYQNKKGYYPVPQFSEQDMIQMLTCYAPADGHQIQ